MDVKHFAFLARQPSAQVQARARFCGLPKRGVALILANAMFWQPLWAQAEGIVVSGGSTRVDQAANGVPIVNIAAPNGSGLSHNHFKDYNVGSQGLILNNATQATQSTQLAGQILGNANLNGTAARIILNEVSGGSPSQLRGYTEVAGQSAHVIVANPYGVSCNGCGFINTPQATLTTGKPVLDHGRLDHYQVDGGSIDIDGAGLNAGNVDRFEIITRATRINARIQARDLTVVAGANDVDASTLNATPRLATAADAPQVAIDSTALGGMYAGAIRLVGTEAGVGVKVAGDMVASGGDIQIDSNGVLSLARTTATGNIDIQAQAVDLSRSVYATGDARVTAKDGSVTVQERLAAGGDLQITARHIDNRGHLEAGARADGSANPASTLTLKGGRLENSGKVLAQGTLRTDLAQLDNRGAAIVAVAASEINAAVLNNQGGTIASRKALTVKASDTLTNTADGLLLAESGGLTITAPVVNNQGRLQGDSVTLTSVTGLDNSLGQIVATESDLQLNGGRLVNDGGLLIAEKTLRIDAASLQNHSGTVSAEQADITLSGAFDNDGGLLEVGQSMALDLGSASNAKGKLRALGRDGESTLRVSGLLNNDQGLVEIGNARFGLVSGGLSNQQGTLRHAGAQRFAVSLADAGQAGGTFTTLGELTLDVDTWSNSSLLQAQKLNLNVGTFTQTASGQLISVEDIEATGHNWLNDGRIETDGKLKLTLAGNYTGNGALQSQGDLDLRAQNVELGQQASIQSAGQGTVRVLERLANGGKLSAAGDLLVIAGDLDNRGTLGSRQKLRIEAPTLLNQGLIFSGADMTLRSDRLTNLKGDVYSLGKLDIAKDDTGAQLTSLENISATLESAGDMSLAAVSLINRKEVFTATTRQTSGQMQLTGTDNCKGEHCEASYVVNEEFGLDITQDSARGNIIAGGNLSFVGGTFDNRLSTVSANGPISLKTQQFFNTGAAGGEKRFYDYYVYTKDEGQYYGLVANIDRYNAYHNPSSPSYDPKAMPLSSIAIGSLRGSRVTQTSGDGQVINAVVQAGGSITIEGSQTVQNAVLRPDQAIETGTSRVQATAVSSTAKPIATLNAQLPPDLAQQGVNPLDLPGFSLPEGQNGLFHVNTDASHPYLVETNPALTNLNSFMNSSYLLERIGYNPAQTQRRLGDGLYEQRLVREAIVAQTGKRLLDGLASDEAQFKYLMDNAVASKTALNLSPGVALSDEQVAALTHDIVWMQEQQVDGQAVLVPVLYLAHANDRLAPTGALIQGSDVALISGERLENSGTLRASASLSATAKNIDNSGLMQANQRIALLASESIRNAKGGVISGQDVSLVAMNGDIVNERSIGYSEHTGQYSWSQAGADNAARIEASRDLTLNAGRDLLNIGGALQAGNNATLTAGRDLAIAAAAEVDSSSGQQKRARWSASQTTQHASDIAVGGNLQADAGRDLAIIASTVKATGNLSLSAAGEVAISAAANESYSEFHRKGGSKKIDKEQSSVRQQAAVLEAGGDLSVEGGGNVLVTASQLKAGDEAYVYAGEQLALMSAQNSDYYLYDYKKKGSFGAKKAQRDEITQITHVGSEIKTGGNLTLVSEGDQRYQVAKLNSGKDLVIDSGAGITFEAVKDLHDESHTKSKSDLSWFSMKGKGTTDETLRQSELVAQGQTVIKAVDGLKIDIKQVDQLSVSQTIDSMVKADPQLAWIKAAEQRGDVDWRQVKEIHDSFKYDNSGLGAGAKIAIAIMMAAVMGPGGLGISGVGGAIEISLATTAVTSTISNKGNLGLALKETFSSDSLKNAAIAGFTAYGLSYADANWFPASDSTTAGISPTDGSTLYSGNTSNDIFRWGTAADTLTRVGGRAVISSGISTAINGGSLGDNFNAALLGEAGNVAMATGFNWVGDSIRFPDGSAQKILAHALMGGMLAEVTGGDFKTGAMAAGLNEALINQMASLAGGNADVQLMLSQLVGLVGAASVGGDLNQGAQIAQKATTFNYLYHQELVERDQKLKTCTSTAQCNEIAESYAELDSKRNAELSDLCQRDPVSCRGIHDRLLAEQPANEKLTNDVRISGEDKSLRRALSLASSGQENYAAQMTTVRELKRPESGGMWTFVSELLQGAMDPWNKVGPGRGSSVSVKGEITDTNARSIRGAVYKTNKDAKNAAEALGYTKINETVHGGQAVFRLGNNYITRDLDGHNGGAWKMAGSVKDLGSKNTRIGTFDEKLQRIGD
ncbi:DUF637 domain-containing protein [Pseudomonas sp. nanlin1]|uniref:two-partner secretion domain-containing protein n=1 Tax=Pseudomonas sp. nanlin1 TaxID=3040605 RepID=UPI00388ECF4B